MVGTDPFPWVIADHQSQKHSTNNYDEQHSLQRSQHYLFFNPYNVQFNSNNPSLWKNSERNGTVPALSFQVFTTEVVYAANPNMSVYFK
jgi:hypothetical protein